jgi:hypothetical protein
MCVVIIHYTITLNISVAHLCRTVSQNWRIENQFMVGGCVVGTV